MGWIGALLAGEWWNGVSAVIAAATAFAAMRLWFGTRLRIDDGYIALSSATEGGRTTVRMQNLGEAGCVIHMVFARGMRPAARGRAFMDGALEPGGELLLEDSDVPKNAELVVVYATTLDIRRVQVARLLPMEPPDDILRLDAEGMMTRRVRREVRYRPGQPLFLHSGLGRTRRIIRLEPIGRDQTVLRGFVSRLISDGYRQVAP